MSRGFLIAGDDCMCRVIHWREQLLPAVDLVEESYRAQCVQSVRMLWMKGSLCAMPCPPGGSEQNQVPFVVSR